MAKTSELLQQQQQQQQQQQHSLSQNDYTKKGKSNNFTGKRNFELLLTRLQTCGRSGIIPQTARTLFFSIPAGKSRPALTESFLAPPHSPINFSVLK